jgi:hypothetical protein
VAENKSEVMKTASEKSSDEPDSDTATPFVGEIDFPSAVTMKIKELGEFVYPIRENLPIGTVIKQRYRLSNGVLYSGEWRVLDLICREERYTERAHMYSRTGLCSRLLQYRMKLRELDDISVAMETTMRANSKKTVLTGKESINRAMYFMLENLHTTSPMAMELKKGLPLPSSAASRRE